MDTAVSAGDCLWFNSKLVPNPSICDAVTSSGTAVTVAITGQTVTFDSGGGTTTVSVPDGVITFSTDASATPVTTYDTASESWQVRCWSQPRS